MDIHTDSTDIHPHTRTYKQTHTLIGYDFASNYSFMLVELGLELRFLNLGFLNFVLNLSSNY